MTNFPQPCKKVAALCIQCECVTSISFHNVGKYRRRFVLIRISVLFIVSTVLSSILLISSQFAYTLNAFWVRKRNQQAPACSCTDVSCAVRVGARSAHHRVAANLRDQGFCGRFFFSHIPTPPRSFPFIISCCEALLCVAIWFVYDCLCCSA